MIGELVMFALFVAGLASGLILRRPAGGLVAWWCALAGSVLGVWVGIAALAGDTRRQSLDWLTAQLTTGVGVGTAARTPPDAGLVLDHLAALFMLLVFAVAIPALMVTLSWWRRQSTDLAMLPGSACALLFACALVILAGNVFVLLAGWELLTVSFYWMTMIEHRRDGRVNAALGAVTFGKVSGASLLLGVLILSAASGSLAVDDLGHGPHGLVAGSGYSLLALAFSIKIGLFPVQVWMPRTYSAAPGPARSLLAGVSVNVGFYGLWRTLDVLGAPPPWLAITLLLLGAFSALIGIAHATVQTRLTHVIAYSSVENAGLITAAYGVALIGAVTSSSGLVAAGLLAATMQVIAHAIAKTLLFSSAGVIESTLGTDEIDELRGVARILPWSGTGLAVGSVTMAGLPPAAIFVSEWFILETLMQQFRLDGQLIYTLPLAIAGALVALTAGFAGVAFVRLAAFTALGRSSPEMFADRGRDVGVLGRVGLVVLLVACPAVAAFAPAEIRVIATGLSSIAPQHLVDQALTGGWVLGPVYRDFSALSPSRLALEMPAMLLVVILLTIALSRGSALRVRQVEPWRSATGGVDGADEYTPFGYANPTRTVLANLLLPRSGLHELEQDQQAVHGHHRTESMEQLDYRGDVVELTESYLYRPLIRPLRSLVAVAKRLQSGRLGAYLLYMLIALVALLAVVTVVS